MVSAICVCSQKQYWNGWTAMKPELKARLERLGPIPGIRRVASGSPVGLALRPAGKLADVLTITAIKALAYRGMALIDAKTAIEEMVEHRQVVVHVPTVESMDALSADLAAAGVRATLVVEAHSGLHATTGAVED